MHSFRYIPFPTSYIVQNVCSVTSVLLFHPMCILLLKLSILLYNTYVNSSLLLLLLFFQRILWVIPLMEFWFLMIYFSPTLPKYSMGNLKHFVVVVSLSPFLIINYLNMH